MSAAKKKSSMVKDPRKKTLARDAHKLTPIALEQLEGAIATRRWGLAHRLLLLLEMSVEGLGAQEWTERNMLPGETEGVAAFRNRKNEKPVPGFPS